MPRVYASRVPDCHPDRPHMARGLCHACYSKQWRLPRAKPRKGRAEHGKATCPHSDRVAYLVSGGPCKSCYEMDLRSRPTEYAETVRRRKRMDQLWKNYGLTPEDFALLIRSQGGVCAICNGELSEARNARNQACVDHSHDTGQVRGVLCKLCNAGLGAFQDMPERLEAAAAYLRAFNSRSNS